MRLTSSTLRAAAISVATVLSSLGASATLHAQAFEWTSAGSSDITSSANWANSTVPTYNATNSTGSFWTDGGSADFVYTASQGTTTFTGGTGANPLTWLGKTGNATTRVTGGTLNLNGSFASDNGNAGLWLGNNGGTSSLIITGGAVNIANGTLLGRDGSTGMLSITNGSFTTGIHSASVGMYFGAPFGNATVGMMTLGNGGRFTLAATATNPFSFGNLIASSTNTTTDFINFTTGSTGRITLNLSGATLGASYFSNLITNGYVQINGVTTTTLSSYAINTSSLTASTLQLASAVPEPSTWAAFCMGGLGLLVWAHRVRAKTV